MKKKNLFRKLFWLLLAMGVSTAVFTSCGEEETPPENPTETQDNPDNPDNPSNPSVIAVSSVSLNKNTLTLKVDESETLEVIVQPDNATSKSVTWTSSNTSIATVSNGKIIAKSAGTTTITAKVGEKTATCTVTVNMDPVNPSTITINSGFQFAAVVNGVAYHKVEGNGAYNGTPWYAGDAGNNYAANYYQSNFENNSGKDYIRITRGSLKWLFYRDVPYGNFFAFFLEGDYNYYNLSSDATGSLNGVEIEWTDNNNVVWSTALGTGNQTGSMFTITDLKSSGNQTKVKVRILFSCTLYNASGNSMKLEQGVFVGEFMNHN